MRSLLNRLAVRISGVILLHAQNFLMNQNSTSVEIKLCRQEFHQMLVHFNIKPPYPSLSLCFIYNVDETELITIILKTGS